ncbi:MAG: TraX family protein [Candidatus Bathyarchaeia archaeon]|jgi:hypothetical protein
MRGFDSGRELLKYIAIITMTIDHIGAVLFPDYEFLRWIGRLAFPLFAYLLILGMEDTHNIRNYFMRLFVFAIVSQVPFFLAIGSGPFEHLNIFFTLAFGLLFVYYFKRNSVFALLPLLVAFVLPIDYSVYGIAAMGCMYILTKNVKLGAVLFVGLNLMFLLPPSNQILSVLALPLILLHNKGTLTPTINYNKDFKMSAWRKYFFYVYYPLHLTLLYLIQVYFF